LNELHEGGSRRNGLRDRFERRRHGARKWQPVEGEISLQLVLLLLQTRDGRFVTSNQGLLDQDRVSEDLGAVFFDADGQLIHQRGVTTVPGLYFLGLRWLHTGGSGFMGFVGRDAKYLAERMTSRPAESVSKKSVFPLSVGSNE